MRYDTGLNVLRHLLGSNDPASEGNACDKQQKQNYCITVAHAALPVNLLRPDIIYILTVLPLALCDSGVLPFVGSPVLQGDLIGHQ